MTEKNGSKKRDRRNLRRLQENLSTVFTQDEFKESNHEPQPDIISKTMEGTGEADSVEKEKKKDIMTIRVFHLSKDVKLNVATNPWKAKNDDSCDVETLAKKLRSILNKLSPLKFDTLVGQVNDLVINTEEKLKKVVNIIFEKAVDKPGFSVCYSKLCKILDERVVEADHGTIHFGKLILQRYSFQNTF